MKRLSGTDTLLLTLETPTLSMHVGGIIILDPSTAADFSFEHMKATMGQRLAALPKFRSKVKEVPFGLDRPIWVEDRGFDLDRHVRHIAVPAPGGRRQVGDLVGQLMAPQLDRRFPLWEAWFIEGVNEGRHVALLLKSHHAIMDGVSGSGLMDQLFDLEATQAPSAARRRKPRAVEEAAGEDPSDLELLLRALPSRAMTPVAGLRYVTASARRTLTVAAAALGDRGNLPGLSAPASPFNGPVGSRRRQAFVSVALQDVKRLRKAWDVKVNDVVLALVAGMARTYLSDVGELPDQPHQPLVALVAVSTRVPGAPADNGGNQIATVLVKLPTDVADPVERLRAAHQYSQAALGSLNAVRATKIQSMGEVAPPLLFNAAARALSLLNAARLPVSANMEVSNIPGPPIPLYSCGAKVRAFYAASALVLNIGLNITCFSYEDRIDFGLMVDPDIVPDPWRLADSLRDALAELMDAAGLGKPEEVADPFMSAE